LSGSKQLEREFERDGVPLHKHSSSPLKERRTKEVRLINIKGGKL